jgi:epoxyqueuosine reductase
LSDPAPLVRAAAIWALRRLLSAEAFHLLGLRRHADDEADLAVRAEWDAR